ncbi:MAG TPA: hypothetical protein VGM98_21185 [Schlesneria sp.]|jgi:hypothetical protein
MHTFFHGWGRKADCDRNMPKAVIRCDSYMDGGSIGATYSCEDLYCQCTLFFQLDSHSFFFGEGEHVRKFLYAELREDYTFQWTSKIVGVTYDDSFHCALRVSWATALQILDELAPQANRLSGYAREVFAEMTNVANSGASA